MQDAALLWGGDLSITLTGDYGTRQQYRAWATTCLAPAS